jgi:hypothetical protein
LFTEILQKSAGFTNTSFLFCGDWNVVQNKSDDTYKVIHDRNQNARKKIEELKETFELLLFCTTFQSPQNKKLVLVNPADFCSISVNNSGLSVL